MAVFGTIEYMFIICQLFKTRYSDYYQVRLPLDAPVLLPVDGTVPEDQAVAPPAIAARAAAVEGVLLLRRYQEPQLRQDGGQPHLRADPLGQEQRGSRQVG